LLPRIRGAELIAVESLNADEGQAQALRGRQFGELQEYLQTIDSAVVDIGASNVEELLGLSSATAAATRTSTASSCRPVPPLKQQQDTIATLIELARLGVPASRLKLVFNMTEAGLAIEHSFFLVLAFVAEQRSRWRIRRAASGRTRFYARIRGTGLDLATLARDDTDYKALIVKAPNAADKLALAHKLVHAAAWQRLVRVNSAHAPRAGLGRVSRAPTAAGRRRGQLMRQGKLVGGVRGLDDQRFVVGVVTGQRARSKPVPRMRA